VVVALASPTADQRILRGTAGQLAVTIRDADGEPDTNASDVTVGVTRADGTQLMDADTAATNDENGNWHVAVTASQTATLDLLTAQWTVSGVVVATTIHEIVGGYLFSTGEAFDQESSLQQKVNAGQLLAIRRAVEDEFERICAVAFVPRFARVTVDGNGAMTVLLPHPKVRTIRSVRVYSSPTTFTDLTTANLAALTLDDLGRLTRADYLPFICGSENVLVTYEHGYDRPPDEIRRAAIVRARERINWSKSATPDRATSYTSAADGGTYRLNTADAFSTGNPEVDAVLARYSYRHP